MEIFINFRCKKHIVYVMGELLACLFLILIVVWSVALLSSMLVLATTFTLCFLVYARLLHHEFRNNRCIVQLSGDVLSCYAKVYDLGGMLNSTNYKVWSLADVERLFVIKHRAFSFKFSNVGLESKTFLQNEVLFVVLKSGEIYYVRNFFQLTERDRFIEFLEKGGFLLRSDSVKVLYDAIRSDSSTG